MQTILGSGGAIGIELAKHLSKYTDSIRLVSRNPKKVNEDDKLFSADLTDREGVFKAIEGSETVYLTVGFEYNTKVWQQQWPRLITHVLTSCEQQDAKLVFFDNVYLYDPESVNDIRESNPIKPRSKKGKVRAEVYRSIISAIEQKKVQATIARSADFYGPSIQKVSVLTETVFNPLSMGKKASILGDKSRVHSYTFTPDAGRALALLGNTLDAYGEVWHLLTSNQKWTTQQFVETIAAKMNVRPRTQAAGRFLVRLLGLFNPMMKELEEMMYQYENDYFFNSDKFQKRFNLTPTPYEKGIDQIIDSDYSIT